MFAGAAALDARIWLRSGASVGRGDTYLGVGQAADISWAVSAAAAIDFGRRRAMYARALALGVAEKQCESVDLRRGSGALRLLGLASLRLGDLALYGELLHFCADEDVAGYQLAPALIGAASGAMELADRALEVHGVQVGYRVEAWRERAVDGAGDELLLGSREAEGFARESLECGLVESGDGLLEGEWVGPRLPLSLEQANLATVALARAMGSTVSDPIGVPGEIAEAIAHLLAIYLVAVEVFSAG